MIHNCKIAYTHHVSLSHQSKAIVHVIGSNVNNESVKVILLGQWSTKISANKNNLKISNSIYILFLELSITLVWFIKVFETVLSPRFY